ncbi:hypothetical protein BDZ45DRAFT_692085 [Acephala macrosclerotiorum]|nr:hypothetical protein BDZ45DRAFT_692085 [Acephala macrosclerotiorum]
MNFKILPLFLGLGLANPLGAPITPKRDFAYETLTFTFHGGPASYELTFPADGSTYSTQNDMNVNLIDPGSFNALYSCNFYYNLPSSVTKTPVLASSGNGNEIAVGPPAPIASVACQPTGQGGQCLPVYAQCECGYCAATKCRPTS